MLNKSLEPMIQFDKSFKDDTFVEEEYKEIQQTPVEISRTLQAKIKSLILRVRNNETMTLRKKFQRCQEILEVTNEEEFEENMAKLVEYENIQVQYRMTYDDVK